MKFKVGDLVRDLKDGRIAVVIGTHSTGYQRVLAIVVNTDRQDRGIIKVQFYGGWDSEWCDQLVNDWRHQ
jgi:hypothetical protein